MEVSACNILKKYLLSGPLVAIVRDETNHYFGGYYHVRLMVRCDVPVEKTAFSSDAEFENGLACLGKTVLFERVLQKMAVPRQEFEDVKEALLQSFEVNVLPYLQRADFADGFTKSQYTAHIKKQLNYRK